MSWSVSVLFGHKGEVCHFCSLYFIDSNHSDFAAEFYLVDILIHDGIEKKSPVVYTAGDS